MLQKDLVEAASVAAMETDDAAREYAAKVQKAIEARLEVEEKQMQLYESGSSQRPGAVERDEVVKAKQEAKAELQRRVSSGKGSGPNTYIGPLAPFSPKLTDIDGRPYASSTP
jgi:TATA-box binding protein (TBP) (component of TFIID and TFIIIB)